MTRDLAKGFDMTPEKEILILKKNETALNFEERLDHGNGDSYLLAKTLYASLNNTGKTHTEGKHPEQKNPTKPEGTKKLEQTQK